MSFVGAISSHDRGDISVGEFDLERVFIPCGGFGIKDPDPF